LLADALVERVEVGERNRREDEEIAVGARLDDEGVTVLGARLRQRFNGIGRVGVIPRERDRGARRRGDDRERAAHDRVLIGSDP
jgi:hypothetical protein